MIAALAASASLAWTSSDNAFHSPARQRADMTAFIHQYNTITTPMGNQITKYNLVVEGNYAIDTIGAAALHAERINRMCPGVRAAVANLQPGISLRPPQIASLAEFSRVRAVMYSAICDRFRASAKQIDATGMYSPSAVAKQKLDDERWGQLGRRSHRYLQAVLKPLGMKYPKDWA